MKQNRKKPPFSYGVRDQLVDRAIGAGLEYDPMLRRTLTSLSVDEDIEPDTLMLLKQKIDTGLQENKLQWKTPYPFKPYPSQEELQGYLKLAKVKIHDHDKKFVRQPFWGIHPFDVLSGILLGGKPKVGKTTFIFKLVFTLMAYIEKYNLDTSIWLFDNKTDYAALARYFPDALVIDSSNMFLNFLEYHEAVGRQKWINNLVEVLCNILYLMEGSSNLFSAAIDELFKIYEGSGFNPTVNDLIKYLLQRDHGKSSRVNEYRGSITNRLEGILSSMGNLLNVSKGLNFEGDLANRRLVVFSLHDLTPTGQALMTMIPILRIFNYRIALGQRFNYPRNVLIFDEAKRIFPKRAEFSHSGASVSTKLFLESREFGFSFIVGDHMINELSDAVKNAYTRVMFRLADYTIPEVARNLYLTNEQAEYFFHLKQGEAIVRYDRYPYPFVIETENVMKHIDKNISKEEIERRMKPLWEELKKNVEPARPEILEEYLKKGSKKNKTESINSVQESDRLCFDIDARMLLENIYEHPFLTTVERYSMLGFSASKGNKALNVLILKGLIAKVSVKIRKGRGGSASLTDIKIDGLKALGKMNKIYTGKGGLKHCYYAKRIAEFYQRKGYDAKQEHLNADIVVKTPEGLLAVEVCIHTSNINENIQRNLDNGFMKTLLVFESKDAMEKANIQTSENIELKLIDEFLE